MTTAPSQKLQPTRARYWVVVFAVTLAILSYIDRVCISQAAPIMSKEFGLDKQDMGWVFGSFAIAYALFEIPGGWLGDWMGPRKVLMRIVIWWSAFTAMTGYTWSFTSLLVVRFLFGAGEAGCFPNLTKTFTTWLPTHERVKAQGIMWMSARWGGAFTPPLVIFVFRFMDWRHAFVLFGMLGVVWAICFYFWFRDNPRDHKSVNAAELELLKEASANAETHTHVPWARLLRSRSVWLLWAQYFCLSFPWYFYITWLPTYLQEHHHLGPAESANLAILPLFFGGLGSLACGFLSSRVASWTGSLSLSRRIISSFGFFAAFVMLVFAINIQNAILAMFAMGLASFFNDFVMPCAWGTCMDVGGKYAGTLAGSMNMMGNLAGFVAPVMGGVILKATAGNWDMFMYVMAGFYLLGTFTWPFIDPVTPIEATPRPGL
jgi:ACS family glucarate transporter-like MFS transporter